jgi:hypothetical protein
MIAVGKQIFRVESDGRKRASSLTVENGRRIGAIIGE